MLQPPLITKGVEGISLCFYISHPQIIRGYYLQTFPLRSKIPFCLLFQHSDEVYGLFG